MTQLKLKRLETFKMLQSQNGLGALSTPQGNLPLKRVEVHTRIAGVIAHITLKQTFKNTLRIPLEATYIFPLPMRAGVHRFTMEVGGRIIEGVLQEREQARREYEQALRQGHRASIAEEERPNVFTIRVGNIMPSEEAHITLEMAMPLEVQDGEVTYQFPLVVAPRYISGIPLDGDSVGDGVVPDTDEVPDASRITPPVLLPGFPNPVQLASPSRSTPVVRLCTTCAVACTRMPRSPKRTAFIGLSFSPANGSIATSSCAIGLLRSI